MDSVTSMAVSGLKAAMTRLGAAASNLANADSAGPIPVTPPTQPVPQGLGNVYQAVTVSQSARGAGVLAEVTPTLPSYSVVYAPDAPYANAQGLVAVPNVDPGAELVSVIQARAEFLANLAMLRTEDKTVKTVLDMTA